MVRFLIGAVLLGVRFLPWANSELIPFREKRLAPPKPREVETLYGRPSQYVMDDGTYDMDIDVRRVGSRCSMGTLVLSGPPTQLDQAHKNLTPDPGYDYDAAYDDEYPPQQPYPHPGIRGLQVTVPHQLTHALLPPCAVRRGRTPVRCWWLAQPSPVGIRGGGIRRRLR